MTDIELRGSVVTVPWLAINIENPRLVVLDASFPSGPFLSIGAVNGAHLRLPKTQEFDYETKICDRQSPLPHTMPSPEIFEQEVRALGINQDSVIVIYDRIGLFASPRAWWMFKAMGHDQVAVLDGGLPAWLAQGLPVESGPVLPSTPGNFVANPREGLICGLDRVSTALSDPGFAVLDARSEGRFHGREPEPRPGLRSGHMPNAINLPYSTVQNHGYLKTKAELQELFETRVFAGQKMIFTCGSGVTACVLALAAETAGYNDLTVYDGSWSEWGLPSDRPVVTT